MDLEAGGQGTGLGGGQVLVEDGIGVGVEVILHQHNFLGLGISRCQALQKAAVVGPGAPGRDLDQALAGARLEGRQQAGCALAHIGAAFAPGTPRLGRLPVLRWLRGHGWERLTGLAVEYAGAFIEADDGKPRVNRALVHGQHVFHARQKRRVYCPQAPVLLALGLHLVFLST